MGFDMEGYNNYTGDTYNSNFSTGMGVYTAESQFDFNPVKLKQLGFNDVEISCLHDVMMAFGRITTQMLQQKAGLTYEQAQRIMYMYNICNGRVQIESEDQVVRHLRKMFGTKKRITIHDLPTSQIQEVPRIAVVAGIKDSAFSIWNSVNYSKLEGTYSVVDVSNGYITIETDRWPVLAYKQAHEIPGVLKIKEINKANHTLKVAIHKDYCKLLNRFAIVASTKRPEFHLGMVKIICIEGTRIYVYAKDIGVKSNISYTANNSRVYAYGYFGNEIIPRLMQVASKIYRLVCGFQAAKIQPNQRFISLQRDKDPEAEESEYLTEHYIDDVENDIVV